MKVEVYLGLQNSAIRGNTMKWVIEIDPEDLEYTTLAMRDSIIEGLVVEAVMERVEWDWTILS